LATLITTVMLVFFLCGVRSYAMGCRSTAVLCYAGAADDETVLRDGALAALAC